MKQKEYLPMHLLNQGYLLEKMMNLDVMKAINKVKEVVLIIILIIIVIKVVVGVLLVKEITREKRFLVKCRKMILFFELIIKFCVRAHELIRRNENSIFMILKIELIIKIDNLFIFLLLIKNYFIINIILNEKTNINNIKYIFLFFDNLIILFLLIILHFYSKIM